MNSTIHCILLHIVDLLLWLHFSVRLPKYTLHTGRTEFYRSTLSEVLLVCAHQQQQPKCIELTEMKANNQNQNYVYPELKENRKNELGDMGFGLNEK